MTFQCLKRSYKNEGDRLFIKVCCDRTRGNGFKPKRGDLDWLEGKSFLTVMIAKHRLPQEVVDSPPLDIQGQAVGNFIYLLMSMFTAGELD